VSQAATLDAFARALRREAHSLSQRPELTWQQLYNRLQWEGAPVSGLVEREFARRTSGGGAPFLKIGTRPVESPSLVQRLVGHTDDAGRPRSAAVKDCAFSPDGAFIVSAAQNDPRLRLWDVSSGRELRSAVSPHGWFTSCAVGPADACVVAGHSDGTIGIWDAQLGQRRARWLAHEHDVVESCDISPGGTIAVSAARSELKIWDLETGGTLRKTIRTGGAKCCRISPDGAVAVAASDDGRLTFWDLEDGVLRRMLATHARPAFACAWSSDGSVLVSAGNDGPLEVWGHEGNECRVPIAGHAAGAYDCAISPDDELVASAGLDGIVKLWRLEDGRELEALAGHATSVRCCAFAPDGSLVASGDADGELLLWEVRDECG
jgi:WD40 repeat protein